MCETDGSPSKDGGQTGNSQHPCECFALLIRGGDVSKETESRRKGDTSHGTTTAINVGEDTGGLALLGQSSKSTGRAVDGGVTNRKNSDHDDSIHD